MPLPVLRLLSPDEFRSGEDIARHLSVTRASVNNAVREAQLQGLRFMPCAAGVTVWRALRLARRGVSG
ncbi:MAG: hypothetical protein IPG66_11150 [Hydrogenophilales bacterium]|nr:hypothetical protein [Hydrogenophilales bacterium]